MIVDVIEEQVVALLALGEVFFGVVDDVIGAERPRDLHVARAANGCDLGVERLCDLQREGPNATRCAVDQHFLAGVNLSCPQPLQRSQPREPNRAGLLEGNVRWLESHSVFAYGYVLRDRAPFYPKDLVARFELTHILTGRFNNTCKVAPETCELWLPQTRHQPEDRRTAHQAGVNEVKGCSANSDEKLVVLRHRLLDLLELQDIGRAVFAKLNRFHALTSGRNAPLAVVGGTPIGNLKPDEKQDHNHKGTALQDSHPFHRSREHAEAIPDVRALSCHSVIVNYITVAHEQLFF